MLQAFKSSNLITAKHAWLVADSTTLGAQLALNASCQRAAHKHHLSPAFNHANSYCGMGVDKSLPLDFENTRNASVTTAHTL